MDNDRYVDRFTPYGKRWIMLDESINEIFIQDLEIDLLGVDYVDDEMFAVGGINIRGMSIGTIVWEREYKNWNFKAHSQHEGIHMLYTRNISDINFFVETAAKRFGIDLHDKCSWTEKTAKEVMEMRMFGKKWKRVGYDEDPVSMYEEDAIMADVMIDTRIVGEEAIGVDDSIDFVDVYVRGIRVGHVEWMNDGKWWNFYPEKKYEGIHMLDKEELKSLVEVAEHVGDRFGIDIHVGVD